MTGDDVAVVGRFMAAFVARDLDGVKAAFHPDGRLRSALLGVTYEGHEGIERYFAELCEAFSELRIDGHVFERAPGGALLHGYTLRTVGRDSEMELAHDLTAVWRVRDGRVRDGTVHLDPREARAEAGLS